MKKVFILFISILFLNFSTLFAQDDAVEVETSIKKISDTEYDLIFDLFIEDDWHLYSQYNPEDASAPLRIIPGEDETGFTLNGKAKESETHTEFSETWGKDEIFFKEEAQLIQRVTIDDPSLKTIMVSIKAQVCKEFCLPFEGDYEFILDKATKKADDKVASSDISKNQKGTEVNNTGLENTSADTLKKDPVLIITIGAVILLLGILLIFFIRKKKGK